MRRKRHGFIIPVLLIAAGITIITGIIAARVRPIIINLGESAVSARVTRTINDTITDMLSDGSISYDRLVTLEKDREGRITAIVTDMAAMNQLRAEIVNEIVNRLSDRDETELTIPLGSLTGMSLLTGKGPGLAVRILSVTRVEASFSNRFTSAGINQTRHEIMLNIDVSITALIPTGRRTVHIPGQICAAETIIVGEVPNSYTIRE